ncbi:MAG: hypothetical protein ACSLFH_12290 [Desulfuromonadales bacterium]
MPNLALERTGGGAHNFFIEGEKLRAVTAKRKMQGGGEIHAGATALASLINGASIAQDDIREPEKSLQSFVNRCRRKVVGTMMILFMVQFL